MSSGGNEESYETKKDEQIPVQGDDAAVEEGVDEATADSDAQLDRDENEAIDKDNIIEGRTRHAKPEGGSYREPGDEEGIPTDD